MSNIHWFPGHMNRALREIGAKAALVDLVVELRDARAALSSANEDVIKQLKNRNRLIVLTKSDMALEVETKKWINFFVSQGHEAISVNLTSPKDLSKLIKAISSTDSKKRHKEATRGMKPQPLRIMVVGVPNVGKSTFINKLAGKKAAQVENRPGKTKAQQWIKVDNQFELLDTPGIMPMKFENHDFAVNLALLGMVKEDILPKEELAHKIIRYLKANHPATLENTYTLSNIDAKDETTIIYEIGMRAGVLEGGKPDINRAIMMLLNDFRNGKIARVSLETI
ncbi:MAG: ribosome biogenesis GTPase YlqF [Bacilli bacterium]|jgi:ribosome biogenesis GTPase A